MLDSLLTLTKGGAAWMAGIFVVLLLLDVGVTAVTGEQEPVFLLLAILTLVALVIRAIYTAAKWVWKRLRGSEPTPPPPPE